jgi:hypothetical protein
MIGPASISGPQRGTLDELPTDDLRQDQNPDGWVVARDGDGPPVVREAVLPVRTALKGATRCHS